MHVKEELCLRLSRFPPHDSRIRSRIFFGLFSKSISDYIPKNVLADLNGKKGGGKDFLMAETCRAYLA